MNTLTNSKDYNAPDPTFGIDGKVLFKIPDTTTFGSSILQTDGKILSVTRATYQLVLVRHLDTGVVDRLFCDQGIKYIDLVPGQFIQQASITLQPDGKAVIAGSFGNLNEPPHKAYLIRVLPDGKLDETFGTGGRLIFERQSGLEQFHSLAIQDDRKIVLVSSITYGFDIGTLLIRRLCDNGEPDINFGTDGVVKPDNINIGPTLTLALGKLLFAGALNNKLMFTRYLDNGKIDPDFGDAGVAIIPVEGSSAVGITDIAQQSDGKIVASGVAYFEGEGRPLVIRIHPNGKPDNAFYGGKPNMEGYDRAALHFAVAIQSDNKVVAAGASFGDSERSNFTLMRYLENGNVDSTFGNDGRIMTDLGGIDMARRIHIQNDGKLLVTGDVVAHPKGSLVGMVRYLNT
ncbi:hypothetical protein [Pseudomonas sp. W15Feb9B]|uniref:hypothetical protein n=1 Tax=Pseudomonas sp. W15Feb9B TaxID=550743 RepID=UPI000597CA18|nr:hypothetical protein [Pseudomonas sp. W15Feb9B]KIK88743.1 hypothetical protein OC71_06290 [Pseudomonas sp. W15Feb9B]